MPSEAALMEQYRVSRNIVRRAYRVLADSGLAVVRHGPERSYVKSIAYQ